MNYWLTTHWPPRAALEDLHVPSAVYIQDGRLSAAHGMEAGDLVFVYETTGGPVLLRNHLNGVTESIPCRQGRGGIIALMQILETPYEREAGTGREIYTSGQPRWWRYIAPAECIDSAGFLSRRDVNIAAGWAEQYVRYPDLRRLEEFQFQCLRAAFCRDRDEAEAYTILKLAETGTRFGSGGEGPVHKALKDQIAADPEAVLGEYGLVLWHKEYRLPTGDRIDLVLKDRFDRFVTVEVEVDCTEEEVAGPLQCIKYRAMMAYLFDRRLEEVRSVLVAHHITPGLAGRCRRHGIEIHVTPL